MFLLILLRNSHVLVTHLANSFQIPPSPSLPTNSLCVVSFSFKPIEFNLRCTTTLGCGACPRFDQLPK